MDEIRPDDVEPIEIESLKQRELLQKGGLAEHLGKMPLGRTGYPDDLAKAVLFMASDLASYVSGTSLTVDGAQTLR